MLSELVYQRNKLAAANRRFLAGGAKDSIVLNKDFQDSQIAHASLLTLENRLDDFDREHGFVGFPR